MRNALKYIGFKRFFAIISKRFRKHLSRLRQWRAAEVVLVSHPKCGRTWLRFFIAEYLSRHFKLSLGPIYKRPGLAPGGAPRVYITHTGAPPFLPIGRHSHEPPRKHTAKKLILLVRDPRDVVVSRYFQITKRVRRKDVQDMSISRFIRSDRFGIHTVIAYMNDWFKYKDLFDDFLLLRYEDCRRDTEKQFRALLHFIGIDHINEDAFAEALEESSFDAMRNRERETSSGKQLKPGDPNDPESYKVRKGKIGGYKAYLGEADMRYIERAAASLNPAFGYTP